MLKSDTTFYKMGGFAAMDLLFEAAIPNIKDPQDSLKLDLTNRNQEGFKHIIILK